MINESGPHKRLLTPSQAFLCSAMDHLHRQGNLLRQADGTHRMSPTEMFIGAVVASKTGSEGQNPDWIAQAAHSLREMVYPLYSKASRMRSANPEFARDTLRSLAKKARQEENFRAMYGRLCDFVHHHLESDYRMHTDKNFDQIMAKFVEVLLRVVDSRGEEQEYVDRNMTAGDGRMDEGGDLQ